MAKPGRARRIGSAIPKPWFPPSAPTRVIKATDVRIVRDGRLIQMSLRERAYARPYASSLQRPQAIGPWINAYNLTRSHSAIGGLTPWALVNNLLGNDT